MSNSKLLNLPPENTKTMRMFTRRVFSKEEIKELFAETNKAIAELAESQKKTDAQLKETDAQLKETDAQLKETDAQLKETAKQIAETDAQLKETDAQLKENAKQIAETDASLKRLGKYHGGLSNNVGSAIEEFFYNALKKKRTLNGIRFDHVERNWGKKGYKQDDEFDIVMLNGTAISVIEVKLQAHKDDIDKILTKQKKRFNEIFPEYKDYEQHWALATFSIDKNLRKKAQASGLTVLRRDGDLLEYNPPMPCGK